MTQNNRHLEIVRLVQQRGFVTIEQLVNHFKVTPQTVRRDLNQLAIENKISRHHGGAGAIGTTSNESYQSRKILNLEAKEKVANALVKMIPDGASLFINIGTTTETIAKALLNHNNLKIVTNNIHVASILSSKSDFSVIIAAGEVRHRDGGIIGEATCDFISQFQMDFGIIGISGVSNDGSLLDFDFREVKVAQAMIENSSNVLLAADHSKFGRRAMVKQGNIAQVDHLFTDQDLTPEMAEYVKQNEVIAHIV